MRVEEYVTEKWAARLEKLVLAQAKRDLRHLGRDSMLSGDDSPLLNVWEEICTQQQGDESGEWWAYEDVIDRILLDKVEQLDRAALLALWAQTEDGFEWLHEHHGDEDGPEEAPVDQDAVVEYLRPLLLEMAADEDNDRVTRFLDPWEEEEEGWEEDDEEEEELNHFELVVDVHEAGQEAAASDAVKQRLVTSILIDGKHLDEPHPIDVPLLVQSLHVEGDYEIFTCDCGVGGCAGIVEGIKVRHDGPRIHWSFRLPQSAGNLMEPALLEWERTASPVALVFDREQMLEAFQAYLGELQELVGEQPQAFDWPVCGVTIQNVLDIDPAKPYYGIGHGVPMVGMTALMKLLPVSALEPLCVALLHGLVCVPESEQWHTAVEFLEPPAGQRLPYVAPRQAWTVLLRGQGLALEAARQEARTTVAAMERELGDHVKWITPYSFFESESPEYIPVPNFIAWLKTGQRCAPDIIGFFERALEVTIRAPIFQGPGKQDGPWSLLDLPPQPTPDAMIEFVPGAPWSDFDEQGQVHAAFLAWREGIRPVAQELESVLGEPVYYFADLNSDTDDDAAHRWLVLHWCCTYKPDAPFVRSLLFASGASCIEALKAALIDPANYSQPFTMNRAFLRMEAQPLRFVYPSPGGLV